MVILATVTVASQAHGQDAVQSELSSKQDVQREYYRLLNIAKDGQPDNKVRLFTFFAQNYRDLASHVQTAVDLLVEAAHEPDCDALFLLAQVLDEGVFVEENDDKAFRYYLLAAQMDHWEAMSQLVALFATSVRDDEDLDEQQSSVVSAKHWNDRLQGHPRATEKWKLEANFAVGSAAVGYDPEDAEGWELLGGAAKGGHDGAISFVRDIYTIVLNSEEADKAEAERVRALVKPIINEIGAEQE